MFKQLVSTMEISLVLVSFDLACLISYFIHSRTVSKMGRKNAIMIGFII